MFAYFACASKSYIDLLLDEGVDAILMSYPYVRKGIPDRLMKAVQDGTARMMLDSGAHTNDKKPGTVVLPDYMEFLKTHATIVSEYVVLDAPSDRVETTKNFAIMKEAGLSPLLVDHMWFDLDNEEHTLFRDSYNTGEKLCWGGIGPGKNTVYDGWLSESHQWTKLHKIMGKRYGKAKNEPISKLHLLAVGQRLRKLLPYFDVVDSFDAATWKRAPEEYGAYPLFVPASEKYPYPRFRQLRPERGNIPQEFWQNAEAYGLNPADMVSRTRMTIRELQKYYAAMDEFYSQVKERGAEFIQQISLRKSEDVERIEGMTYPIALHFSSSVEKGKYPTKEMFADLPRQSEEQLVQLHWDLHTAHREKPEDASLENWHAQVVDALYDKGIKHPPPPDDGLDGKSAFDEANVESQPDYTQPTTPPVNEARKSLMMLEKVLRVQTEKQRGPYNRWGGSSKYAQRIIKSFPPHETYVEPFVGSASVLYSKEPSKVEIVADLDTEVVHALTMIKNLNETVVKELQQKRRRVTARQWKELRYNIPEGDVDRLHRFLYLQRGGFAGIRRPTPNIAMVGQIAYEPEKLMAFKDRLANVTIENADYKATLQKYDSTTTFAFIDPPWEGEWSSDASDVEGEGTVPTQELIETVRNLQGKWILEMGDHEAHQEALKSTGGRVFTLDVLESRPAGGGGNKKSQRYFATNVPEAGATEPEQKAAITTDATAPSDAAKLVASFLASLKEMMEKGEVLAPTIEKSAGKYETQGYVPIIKVDEEKRLVTGIVLEPDEIDAQKDTISPDVIELAAHDFLADYNNRTKMGLMHKVFGDIGVELVESWIAREDGEMNGSPVKKGSWLMTVKVLTNTLWKKIKDGEITGFSIGGVATVE